MKGYLIGDQVRTTQKIAGVPLEAVPVRSQGTIMRYGHGELEGGYMVRLYDKTLKSWLEFFCEPEEIRPLDVDPVVYLNLLEISHV